MIEKKVKCVYQEDEMLKNLLREEIDAALLKVYMKPQGITYKINEWSWLFQNSRTLEAIKQKSDHASSSGNKEERGS